MHVMKHNRWLVPGLEKARLKVSDIFVDKNFFYLLNVSLRDQRLMSFSTKIIATEQKMSSLYY